MWGGLAHRRRPGFQRSVRPRPGHIACARCEASAASCSPSTLGSRPKGSAWHCNCDWHDGWWRNCARSAGECGGSAGSGVARAPYEGAGICSGSARPDSPLCPSAVQAHTDPRSSWCRPRLIQRSSPPRLRLCSHSPALSALRVAAGCQPPRCDRRLVRWSCGPGITRWDCASHCRACLSRLLRAEPHAAAAAFWPLRRRLGTSSGSAGALRPSGG